MKLKFTEIQRPLKNNRGSAVVGPLTPVQLRARAYNIYGLAITTGRVRPQPCCICGEKKAQAHHEDYHQPYLVTYLCSKHHAARHAELRRGALSQLTAA